MAMINTMKMVAILDNYNMSGWHKLRNSKQARELTRGQCLVAFNRKMTIGRIIDSAGGVHTWYAPPKEVFDLAKLSAMIQQGFWIDLRVAASVRQKATDMKLVA